MPHVDMLFSQLQKRNIDSVYIKGLIKRFTSSIQTIRDSIPPDGSVQQPPTTQRRALGHEEHQRYVIHTESRKGEILLHQAPDQRHPPARRPVRATQPNIPRSSAETAVEASPLLDKAQLETGLSLVYDTGQFRACSGAVTLLQFFVDNNLQETFTETVSLLKVLVTTPMAAAERCFSTLKRIKTFLRNSMSQDRPNALAMLSIENKLISSIPDFNTRVIERFATQKERRATFLYT
ncbi:hypothetical protein KUCAC02_032931 [Chaenocephalus aceratus]|nr:hypothetical protein KUCAC02_032931 [Chaenocephalus aceratus]